MLKFWENSIEAQRAEAPVGTEPFACPLEQAQDWCNFVVLRPDWLPDDCHLAETSVRPESEEHCSTVRMKITGPGRSFRLKQFFLDWWIPTSSDANLTGPGTPFEAAGLIGYRGRDYRGRVAICLHRYGALHELAVLQGRFEDEELQQIFEHLVPQSPEAVQQLGALPFARLSYHVRKGLGPGPGPWNQDLLSRCHWSADPEGWKSAFDPRTVYTPGWLPESFAFDSAGTRMEPEFNHIEYQLIYRHRGNLSDIIWLRGVGEQTEKVLWIAPGLDRRMNIQMQSVQLGHRTVRVGSVSEPMGERVAQWIEDGIALEIHASASRHLTRDDFLRILDSLSRTVPTDLRIVPAG